MSIYVLEEYQNQRNIKTMISTYYLILSEITCVSGVIKCYLLMNTSNGFWDYIADETNRYYDRYSIQRGCRF